MKKVKTFKNTSQT